MSCPYIGCGGDPRATHDVINCKACGRPISLCPRCQTPNSTFARYCRHCGEPKDRQAPDFLTREKPTLVAPSSGQAEPRLIQVDEPFWVAPVEYREYLWLVSARGAAYRLSVSSDEAEHVCSFGDGFGSMSFSITEVPGDPGEKDWTPYLLAANPGGISGLNLITLEVRKFLQLDRNEHILASFRDKYVTLVSDGRHAYFLKTRGTQTYLSACDLLSGQCDEHPLGSQPVAGPFSVGRDVGVYSKDHVRVLAGGDLREYRMPRNFDPWVSPSESGEMQTPLGRMPFMSYGRFIYIPGWHVERGAESRVAGLRVFSLVNGAADSTDFIPAREEASYWPDTEGHPVIAQKGAISVYEGGRGRVVLRGEQLVGRGPAFHEKDLTLCFTRSSWSGELLSLYQGAKVVSELPFTYYPDYRLAGGYYRTVGAVSFIYRTDRDFIRALVWDMHAG